MVLVVMRTLYEDAVRRGTGVNNTKRMMEDRAYVIDVIDKAGSTYWRYT